MGQEAPGCLGALLGLFGMGRAAPSKRARPCENERVSVEAYRVRDDFLSPAEASFYRVLRLVVGEKMVVCPKVRLGDLFFVTRAKENWGAVNRINAKHVDLLLLDPATLKPLAGLELDDASHRMPEASERDDFKDRLFKSAGLPLLRVPVQRAYEVGQVAALLANVPGAAVVSPEPAPVVSNAQTPEPAHAPIPRTMDGTDTPPDCPKCDVAMTLRTAKQGKNQGG